jgi:hypothetical protein
MHFCKKYQFNRHFFLKNPENSFSKEKSCSEILAVAGAGYGASSTTLVFAAALDA